VSPDYGLALNAQHVYRVLTKNTVGELDMYLLGALLAATIIALFYKYGINYGFFKK